MSQKNKYWASGPGIRSPRATELPGRVCSPRIRPVVAPSHSVQDLRTELGHESSLDEQQEGRLTEKAKGGARRDKWTSCLPSEKDRRRPEESEQISLYDFGESDRPYLLEKMARERANRNIEINLNFDKGKVTVQDFEEILTNKTIECQHLNGEYHRDRVKWQAERKMLQAQLSFQYQQVARLNFTINSLKANLLVQDDLVKVLANECSAESSSERDRTPRSTVKVGRDAHEDYGNKIRLRDIEEKTRRLGEMERQERVTAQQLISIIHKLRSENLNFKKRNNIKAVASVQTQTDQDQQMVSEQEYSFEPKVDRKEFNLTKCKIEKLEEDVVSLTQQVSNHLNDRTILQQQKNNLKAQLAQSKHQAKKEMERLMTDLNSLAGLLMEKETENDELLQFQSRADKLNRTNKQLRSVLIEYQKQQNVHLTEKIALQDHIFSLEAELKQTLRSNTDLEKQLIEANLKLRDNSQKMVKLQKQLQMKQANIQVSKQQQQSKQFINSLTLQICKLSEQLQIVGSQLQLNNGLNKDLKLRNDTLQKQLASSDVKSRNEQQQLIDHLGRQISLVSEQIQQINSQHRNEVTLKDESLMILRQALGKQQNKCQYLQSQRRVFNQQIAALNEKLQQSEKKLALMMCRPVNKQVQIQTNKIIVPTQHIEVQTQKTEVKRAEIQTQILQTRNREIQTHFQSSTAYINTENILIQNKQSQTQSRKVNSNSFETQTQSSETLLYVKETQTNKIQVIDTMVQTEFQQNSPLKQKLNYKPYQFVEINMEQKLNTKEVPTVQTSPHTPQSKPVSSPSPQKNQQQNQQILRLTDLVGQLEADLKLERAQKDDAVNEKNKIQELMLQRANKHQQQLKTMFNTNQQIAKNLQQIAERNAQLQCDMDRLKGQQSQSFLRVNSNIKQNSSVDQDSPEQSLRSSKAKEQFKLDNIEQVEQEYKQSMVCRLQSLLSQPSEDHSKSIEANNMVDAIDQLPHILPQHNFNTQSQRHHLSIFAKKDCFDQIQESSIKNSPDFSLKDQRTPRQGSEFKDLFQTKIKQSIKKINLKQTLENILVGFLHKLYEYPNIDELIEYITGFATEIQIYESEMEHRISDLQQRMTSYISFGAKDIDFKPIEQSEQIMLIKTTQSQLPQKKNVNISQISSLSASQSEKSQKLQNKQQSKAQRKVIPNIKKTISQSMKKSGEDVAKLPQTPKSSKSSINDPTISPKSPIIQRSTNSKKVEVSEFGAAKSNSSQNSPSKLSQLSPKIPKQMETPKAKQSKFSIAKKSTKK